MYVLVGELFEVVLLCFMVNERSLLTGFMLLHAVSLPHPTRTEPVRGISLFGHVKAITTLSTDDAKAHWQGR